MVTQYAPLVGLKGIGLLNSYTVWTDRRENSPHHGYAFPSQQAEAAFYGEERAELITINKILVALDLIEIRKEMISRTDAAGRRWRVPHNLYRVKDREGGPSLRLEDVRRVTQLAAEDEAVFRYLKRLFSPRFEPIDRENVWHQILIQVRDDPPWQALAGRVEAMERRASARTKAGHRNRTTPTHLAESPSGELLTGGHIDGAVFIETEQTGDNPLETSTSVALSTNPPPPAVAPTNNGSNPAVARSNTALTQNEGGSVAQTNPAPPGAVAPGNTTYYQPNTTTTTTTGAGRPEDQTERPEAAALADGAGELAGPGAPRVPAGPAAPPPVRPSPNGGSGPPAEWGDYPAAEPGLVDGPSPLVLSLFEAANDRRASRLERLLLSELERDAAPAAEAVDATGPEWVAAALREAVASGSSFVAPKRVREILVRWAADGHQPLLAASPIPPSTGPEPDAPTPLPAGDASPSLRPPTAAQARAWEAALDRVAATLDRATYQRLLAGSRLLGWRGAEAVVAVASPDAVEKLSREYRPLVERALGQRFRKQVTVSFQNLPGDNTPASGPDQPVEEVFTIRQADYEQGRMIWQAALAELALLRPGDGAQLAEGVLLGETASGALALGLSSQRARRLVEESYRPGLEHALANLLGLSSVRLEFFGPTAWRVDGPETA
jgi:hypothetical protein